MYKFSITLLIIPIMFAVMACAQAQDNDGPCAKLSGDDAKICIFNQISKITQNAKKEFLNKHKMDIEKKYQDKPSTDSPTDETTYQERIQLLRHALPPGSYAPPENQKKPQPQATGNNDKRQNIFQ